MAAPGEEGQIIADLLGDEAFEGYHRRPDANAKSLHGGWYFTEVKGDGPEEHYDFCFRRCHAAAPYNGAWLDYRDQ